MSVCCDPLGSIPTPCLNKTRVQVLDVGCVVNFDDDLPNGPFVEGSAGNILQPSSFTATVPTTGATWGLVATLVLDSHQAELDRFCQGGKMKSNGDTGNYIGVVATAEAINVMCKGGVVPADGPAKKGSCTVQLRVTRVIKYAACCVLL